MLKGYKTYITGAVAIIGAVASYLTGDVSLVEAVQIAVPALMLMFTRSGINSATENVR